MKRLYVGAGHIMYTLKMMQTNDHRFVLTGYVEAALAQAEYDKLDDATFAGKIPVCPGVLAFADTLRECEAELRSVLEDWILLGLKMNHQLPSIGPLDLNHVPTHA